MVNFEPTPEQQRFIDAQLRSGRFRDVGEILRAGLDLWMRTPPRQSYEEWLADARQKIREGLDELDRGEVVDGETVLREMEARIERHRQREEAQREEAEKKAQP